MTDNYYVKSCTDFHQFKKLVEYSKQPNKFSFFYTPPSELQIYHITCIGTTQDNDNEDYNSLFVYSFYYQHDNNYYKISCCLISHSFINRFLNNRIHNFERLQNDEQQLTFSNTQRENLQASLKQSVLCNIIEKMTQRKNLQATLKESELSNILENMKLV